MWRGSTGNDQRVTQETRGRRPGGTETARRREQSPEDSRGTRSAGPSRRLRTPIFPDLAPGDGLRPIRSTRRAPDRMNARRSRSTTGRRRRCGATAPRSAFDRSSREMPAMPREAGRDVSARRCCLAGQPFRDGASAEAIAMIGRAPRAQPQHAVDSSMTGVRRRRSHDWRRPFVRSSTARALVHASNDDTRWTRKSTRRSSRTGAASISSPGA